MTLSRARVCHFADVLAAEGFVGSVTLHVKPEVLHDLNREARELFRYTGGGPGPDRLNRPIVYSTSIGDVTVREDRKVVLARIDALKRLIDDELKLLDVPSE